MSNDQVINKDGHEVLNEHVVLAVSTNPTTSTYTVHACQGSSVNEIAFAVHVVIKTLIRDGLIKTKSEFDKLVKKYFTDSQYDEVTNDET